jgi:hypothetical protein
MLRRDHCSQEMHVGSSRPQIFLNTSSSKSVMGSTSASVVPTALLVLIADLVVVYCLFVSMAVF